MEQSGNPHTMDIEKVAYQQTTHKTICLPIKYMHIPSGLPAEYRRQTSCLPKQIYIYICLPIEHGEGKEGRDEAIRDPGQQGQDERHVVPDDFIHHKTSTEITKKKLRTSAAL